MCVEIEIAQNSRVSEIDLTTCVLNNTFPYTCACRPLDPPAYAGASRSCFMVFHRGTRIICYNLNLLTAIAFDHCCFDQETHLPRDPDEGMRCHQPIVIYLQ